jgi:two-component system, sensor histidine kinase
MCDSSLNGLSALNKIKQNVEQTGSCKYDLILMDCNMPIMDGYESSIAIRKFFQSKGLPQPVIIAVTGHTAESYI